ncbi:MAG: Trm112 family protein [Hyphomicrobiaceae bacterium]
MSDDAAERASVPTEKGSAEAAAPAERVDRKLLELLVCPVTKTSLDYDEARQELISRKARLAYPIRRGVPHMLPSEARRLDD